MGKAMARALARWFGSNSGTTIDDSFRDRVVVITGASAGVGRATARRFAQAGARVGLIARDPAALEETKAELESIGGTAHVFAGDVADADVLTQAAESFEASLGPIEVWVNCAMVTVYSPISELTPEEIKRVTDVTYLGTVYGTLAALRHMRPRDVGTIVQVGSALAYRAIPLQSAYCGAKHAVRGFTESLRSELIHEDSHIALTEVHLPGVNTPQFDWARARHGGKPRPVPPIFQPEEAAEAIAYAAANPGEREYWLGRGTASAILGNMLAPFYLDRYLARFAVDAQSAKEPGQTYSRDNLFTPEHGLHRTRGSYGHLAGNGATLLPGNATRIAAIIGGCALSVAAGLMLARLFESRSVTPRERSRVGRRVRPAGTWLR